ncbi:hypothetical protein CTA2_8901 [Colletotrichum tanaceti]|nr:hypothetical protein CTA2_8901 [Colletotrichum tanaceti]
MHSLRDPDLVHPRGRDRSHVRRPAGLRGHQLRPQAPHQGRAAPPYSRQGLRHAQLPRPVRRLLVHLPRPVPAGQAPALVCAAAPPPVLARRARRRQRRRARHRRRGGLEPDIPRLPHRQAGTGRVPGRVRMRRRLVRCHGHREGHWPLDLGLADPHCAAFQIPGPRGGGGPLPSWLGQVGGETRGGRPAERQIKPGMSSPQSSFIV